MADILRQTLLRYADVLPWLTFVACLAALSVSVASMRRNGRFLAAAYGVTVTVLCLLGRASMLATPFPLSDESEQITAALAVIKHGAFFGRVFVGTHGPGMTLVLAGLTRCGLPLDSIHVHLLVLVWQLGVGVCLLVLLRQCGLGGLTRLAGFGYFVFVAFTLDRELTTYNGEVITGLFPLLALVFLLAYRERGRRGFLLLSGLCLGLIPFFKPIFLSCCSFSGSQCPPVPGIGGETNWRFLSA